MPVPETFAPRQSRAVPDNASDIGVSGSAGATLPRGTIASCGLRDWLQAA